MGNAHPSRVVLPYAQASHPCACVQGAWGFWNVPGSDRFHVWWSGVAEVAGGLGLLLGKMPAIQEAFPWLYRLSAACLLVLAIAVTPANIFLATHSAPGPFYVSTFALRDNHPTFKQLDVSARVSIVGAAGLIGCMPTSIPLAALLLQGWTIPLWLHMSRNVLQPVLWAALWAAAGL